jgi:hypothetical protein
MQTRTLLIFCALTVAGCGGSNKESLEKKVRGLQDEVTRLQNSQDRVAERLQSLEIQTLREKPAAAGATAKEESNAIVRPPLKVVKLTPGTASGSNEAAPPAMAEAAPEDDGAVRPVLRDYGEKPKPWQKAPGKPAATSTRAPAPRLGQNDSGPPPATPQGN